MNEREIFLAALRIDEDQARSAYLEQACGSERRLKDRIVSLLRSSEAAGNFMESPASAVLQAAAAAGEMAPAQAAEPAEQKQLESGVLGDYRILREIGRGGMGIVYEAEQISLARTVALKVLPYAAMLDKTQLTRFKNEARAAASLDHPHVVHVHSVGSERGVHYYAMQYIEGRTVADVIAGVQRQRGLTQQPTTDSESSHQHEAPETSGVLNGPSSSPSQALKNTSQAMSLSASTRRTNGDQPRIREIVRLAIQAANALEHAHQMGIVHRDIKPSNLLLDDEQHLWVTDFGLAIVETQGDLTASGGMLGTLRYMSPEQMRGDRRILDHTTDIYSLGTTLYEMLTLHAAFPDRDATRLMQRVPHDAPIAPRKLNPAISHDLETIVLKALAKEPKERYATAGEMADDMKRFLDDQPIHAKPPGTIDRATKWVRRRWGIVCTAAVTLFVAFVIAACLLWQERSRTLSALARETNQRELADRQRRNAEDQEKTAKQQRVRANEQKQLAERQRAEVQRLLYIADMKLASDAVRRGDALRAASLLKRHLPGPNTQVEPDFEWYYLTKQVEIEPKWRIDAGSRVRSVRLSPRGDCLAIATREDGIQLVEADTGRVILKFAEPDAVNGIAWSPCGTQIAAASADGMIRLWSVCGGPAAYHSSIRPEAVVQVFDAQTDPALLTTRDDEGEANDLLFTPDGKSLISCGDDAFIRVWDLSLGEEVALLKSHKRQIERLALSPDGNLLAAASSDQSVLLWDMERRAVARTISKLIFRDRVTCVAFSRDGTLCAGGDTSGRVHVHHFDSALSATQTLIDGIDSVAILDSPLRLVTGDRGGAIQIRSIALAPDHRVELEEAPIAHWIAHPGRVETLAVDYEQQILFSGSRDGTVAAWQAAPSPRLVELGTGTDCCVLSNGRVLVSDEDLISSSVTGAERFEFEILANDRWQDVAASQETARIAAATNDLIVVYDTAAQEVVARWEVGGEVHRIALSPDGAHVAISWWHQIDFIDVWSVDDPADRRRLPARQCDSLAFSPDGHKLAAGYMDDVRVFDLTSADNRPQHLAAHGSSLTCTAFHPREDILATVSSDRHLKLWETGSGRLLRSAQSHEDSINYVSFSRDGRRIATTGDDGFVRLWDTETLQPLLDVRVPDGKTGLRVEFTPDGRQLIVLTGANSAGETRVFAIPSH